jgi:sulfoxide reductase heme-binding subunit YedZ
MLSPQISPRALLATRIVLFVAGLLPLAWIVFALFTGGLGINPVEAMIRELGRWGLRLLLLTLAITPLRQLTGAAWLIRLRRMIGLYAFTYVTLHFLAYAVFDNSLSLALIVEDVTERWYILVGAAALLLLIPLALTSTQGWMRRLGRRWKQLHRLVYPAAVLGVFHFFMIIRADAWTEPLIYAAILALLLGWRLLWPLRGALRRAPAAARQRG